jgi:hypothetical protein
MIMADVKTLYLLGAGCSRNYIQSETRIAGLMAPLNNDFFRMARRVIDDSPRLVETYTSGDIIGLGHFIRAMNRLYGYGESEEDTHVFDDERLTLEGVMDHFYLSSELLSSYRGDAGGSRVRVLNELVALVIAEALRGPPCSKHALLAARIQEADVVINMNYDLLLDNALYGAGKLVDSGYNVRFDYTLTQAGWERTNDKISGIPLLKLHGSLNWVRCERCGRNLLLRGQKSTMETWGTLHKSRLKCPKCDAGAFTGLQRIMIPPAGTKTFNDPDVRYLWLGTPSRCDGVEKIVVIGYRFSETDSELEMLFRTMVKDKLLKRDTPITIVNPNPEQVQIRLRSVFDRAPVTTVPSLDLFLG